MTLTSEQPAVARPEIVAVVPAFNAGGFIEPCIAALRATGFAPAEIIVVDDASTDDTVARCRAAGVEPLRLEGNSGPSAARDAGLRASDAPIVLFVDADVFVAPDGRAVAAAFFAENPGYAAVFGAYDDAPLIDTRLSRLRNLLHRHVHRSEAGDAVTFWTGLGALRREAYEAVGGFSPTSRFMEDVELGMKMAQAGYKIRLLPTLEGKHAKEWRFFELLRTDIWGRAVPWVRLMRSTFGRSLPMTHAASVWGRLSVLSVGVGLLAVPGLLIVPGFALGVIVLSLLALGLINRSFLGSLWKRRGALEAAAGLGVLWLYYLCGGIGFALVATGLDRPLSGAGARLRRLLAR
ncbi:MAG: glycosyltransferase [Pseudomonadota bacterium]